MRILSILIWVFIIHSGLYAQERDGATKVLFIGNSYTYVNDLPQMLKDLSQSMGKSLYTDQNTPGGAQFNQHATNALNYTKMHSEDWDYVVLQGQSQEPSWPISDLQQAVLPYAKQLCDSIHLINPCSEILFFNTWGRENGDDYNCPVWPPVCTFEGMNNRLLLGYHMMAEQNDASISPVGAAWKIVREDNLFTSMNLYSADGSHPSVYGTYLAACVFYNSIFKDAVSSDFYSTLTEDEALYLQGVANHVFSTGYSYFYHDNTDNIDLNFTRNTWLEMGISVLADFDYSLTSPYVSFLNMSINADNVSWNFGDGNTSIIDNPSNDFVLPGQYFVELISSNQCFTDTVIKPIHITTDINDIRKNQEARVWANGQDLIIDQIQDWNSIEIFDITAKKMASFELKQNNRIIYPLNTKMKSIIVRLSKNTGEVVNKKIVF